MRRIFFAGPVVVAATAAALTAAEGLLWLAGSPVELERAVAHPPDLVEHRQSIEFEYDFRSNRLGLRDRDIDPDARGAERRVWIAGDSAVEGTGVEAGERFGDLLEASFGASAESGGRPVRFVNGGLAGTGPAQYGRAFRELAGECRPDGLLLVVNVNDVVNTPERPALDPLAAPPLTRSGTGRLAHRLWPRLDTRLTVLRRHRDRSRRTVPTDFVATVAAEARRRGIDGERIERWRRSLPVELVAAIEAGRFNGSILAAGLLTPDYWTASIDLDGAAARRRFTTMTAVLDAIVGVARRRSVEVAVVLAPAPFQYEPRSHEPTNPWIATGTTVRREWLDSATAIERELGVWAAGAKVPFLDLTPVLRAAAAGSAERLEFPLDGHWNATGNQVVAAAIGRWLRIQRGFAFLAGDRR